VSWGILKFKLPEEQSEFNTASMAPLYKKVLMNVDEYLRRKLKYEPSEKSPALQEVRDALHRLLEDYNLDILE